MGAEGPFLEQRPSRPPTQARGVKLLKKIEELPKFVALRITETPCQCAECRQAGKVGFPEPPDTPHHFTWCCAGHALKRIKLSYYAKRKGAFQRPSGKSIATKQNELSWR
jgi:hypothetical protein